MDKDIGGSIKLFAFNGELTWEGKPNDEISVTTVGFRGLDCNSISVVSLSGELGESVSSECNGLSVCCCVGLRGGLFTFAGDELIIFEFSILISGL